MLKKCTFGFEPWGLALFLLVMIPTVIWSAVPAPNDVLRTPFLGFTACHVIYAAVNFLR